MDLPYITYLNDYYNNKNVYLKENISDNPIKKKKERLLNRLDQFQQKILDFLNIKLDLKLKLNEIKLELNNKNIGNIELNLLSAINFNNLEELNLSHNNITNIDSLNDFNFKKLKKIDLSFNKINKINPSEASTPNLLPKKEQKIDVNDKKDLKEKILLNNHIEINLDENNLIQKDIEEIKCALFDKKKESIEKDFDNIDISQEKEEILKNKIDKLEKKVLYYFNNKLELQLTGNEIKLYLNNKNINNIDLSLLCEVNFKNLEEINLSNNNISNIEPIQNLKKLKKIDLSFNKINNIDSLKGIIENNKDIKEIKLNNNEIRNDQNIKENYHCIEINLENNNIIKKDIESINNSINCHSSLISIKILIHEFKDLIRNPIANIAMAVGMPNENNIYEWRCAFIGPEDTPYKGGLFYLSVLFSHDYPNTAPQIKFITPIYHPNVYSNPLEEFIESGSICLPFVFWRREIRMKEVFKNIFALFYFANAYSTYNLEIQEEMIKNPSLYEKKQKYFTKIYADPLKGYREYDKWDFSYNENIN